MIPLGLSSGLAALAAAVATLAWLRSPRERGLTRDGNAADPRVVARPAPAWAAGRRGPGWRGLLRGRADAPPWPRRWLVSAVAAVTLSGLIGLITSGPVGWAALPGLTAAGAVVLGLAEPAAARRRQRRLVMDTPHALELLAGCLAAGLPPRNATAAVVAVFDGRPVAEDLGSVLTAIEVGLSDAGAWQTLRGHPTLGEAAVDLARSVDSGTMLVETLSHYADQARRRRAGAIEVAARAVGVRCVLPMMACFIPAFILLGIVPTVASAFLGALPQL